MEKLLLENHEIELYSQNPAAPLVVCHYADDGEEIVERCRQAGCSDFTLAVIRNIHEDDDMSPYQTEELKQFRGGAGGYCNILTADMLPRIEKRLGAKPEAYLLAGYSLAGLFAVYAMYQTGIFSKIIACSGSFWYPGFVKYVTENTLVRKPEKMYFSVGEAEKKAKNRWYRNVEACTAEIERYFHSLEIQTVFEYNEGGHFQDVNGRLARGITWALQKGIMGEHDGRQKRKPFPYLGGAIK